MSDSDTLINPRDLAFILYELLGAEALIERPRFADHSRETFDAVIETARAIALKSFAPHNRKGDEHEPQFVGGRAKVLPEAKAAVAEMAAAGFLAAHHDLDRGGMQLPLTIANAAYLHFQAANGATASYGFLTVGAANLLDAFGSAALKARYLPPMLDGRVLGTMALTEPQAGSSLADIRTRAEPQPEGHYHLTGTKIFISGGDHDLTDSIHHMVLARLPDAPPGSRGISLFLVPTRLIGEDGQPGPRNGVTLAGLIHKMGWRGTTSTILNFGEREPAIGYLVGPPHQGLACMFQMMNEARISVGQGAVALSYPAYLRSLEYARGRPQGRPPSRPDQRIPPVPIIQHADVRRMLLAQKAVVEGALALVLTAARLVDDEKTHPDPEARRRAGILLGVLTPVVKAWPSDACQEALSNAIQIHGGYGYTRDYPIEQSYRDNRLNPIHEGTNGIQGIDLVGRKLRAGGGADFAILVEEIAQSIAEARTVGGAAAVLAESLDRALETMVGTSRRLLRAFEEVGAERALANATLHLDLVSRVVIGWIWLRQATVATRALGPATADTTTTDRDFYRGKIQAARYWMGYELPLVFARAPLLDQLDTTALEAEDAWF